MRGPIAHRDRNGRKRRTRSITRRSPLADPPFGRNRSGFERQRRTSGRPPTQRVRQRDQKQDTTTPSDGPETVCEQIVHVRDRSGVNAW